MNPKPIFTAGSVNQSSFCLDIWRNTDLVCYGSSINLMVYNIKEQQIIGVSPAGHTGNITSVRCAEQDGILLALSMSYDSSARLWRYQPKESSSVQHVFSLITTIKVASGAVTIGDLSFISSNKVFVAITGDEFLINTYSIDINDGSTEHTSKYKLPGRSLVLDLRLLLLDKTSWPVIVCGGDDSKVTFLASRDSSNYTPCLSLSGHEDWVTCLQFYKKYNGDILMASGAKDGLIRIWEIESGENKNFKSLESNEFGFKPKSFLLDIPIGAHDKKFCCSLNTVLDSHEGIVADLCWIEECKEEPILLSCSKTEDRTVISWKIEPDTGVWVESARLGEVGGNREGFLSCKYVSSPDNIVAVSYPGGIHYWHMEASNWNAKLAVSGHFDQVVDICWDTSGQYLLSTSKDQTTRLFAPWKRSDGKILWHEISRPQVHGYDMACVVALDPFRFVSGAEEKVLRGFSAPGNIIRCFGQICNVDVSPSLDKYNENEGALVPSLGLSNKGVSSDDSSQKEQKSEKFGDFLLAFKSLNLSEPPTEDQLMLGTLWPEISKLYGHGNEILALSATSDGSILASACRAKSSLDANIILWDTSTWQQISSLSFHNLSITKLAFSYDDQYLLSVSRDRNWAVYKRKEKEFEVVTYGEKKNSHSRVIWDCCWIPSCYKFITGSRDKSVYIWNFDNESNTCTKEAVFNSEQEVTAVAATEINIKGKYLIAVGHVNGELTLFDYSIDDKYLSNKQTLNPCHKKTIRRIAFNKQDHHVLLASCGDDNSIWIYEIKC